jgi:hypothetical protein
VGLGDLVGPFPFANLFPAFWMASPRLSRVREEKVEMGEGEEDIVRKTAMVVVRVQEGILGELILLTTA